MSEKDSRPKLTYSGLTKKLIEETKSEDDNVVTVSFTAIPLTGEAAERAANEIIKRTTITHECVEKESPERMEMFRRVGKLWGKYVLDDPEPMPDPDELILDESTLSVYFLDDMGLLRFLGTDSIPYYVFIDPEGNPNHIHPEVVYIPEEGEVIEKGQAAPKGYMFIAAPEHVSEEAKERNKNFRDSLNGGAN